MESLMACQSYNRTESSKSSSIIAYNSRSSFEKKAMFCKVVPPSILQIYYDVVAHLIEEM